MKTEEIKQRIINIQKTSTGVNGPELAHVQEDSLHLEFIKYVATAAQPDLAAKAKLVASTEDIKFERWFT